VIGFARHEGRKRFDAATKSEGWATMTGVDRLFNEHPIIMDVVDTLSKFVDELEAGAVDSRCELGRMMTFFREYAELFHHEKEESILWPALVHAGLRWDDGLIADVRRDHEVERTMLQSLRHSSLQTTEWSVIDRQRVIDVCRRFVDFMRQHVMKENETLRPLIEEKLDGPSRAALDENLDRFDARLTANGELKMLTDLATNLGQNAKRAH
jgi:hemerythrin-like domain-containing protein